MLDRQQLLPDEGLTLQNCSQKDSEIRTKDKGTLRIRASFEKYWIYIRKQIRLGLNASASSEQRFFLCFGFSKVLSSYPLASQKPFACFYWKCAKIVCWNSMTTQHKASLNNMTLQRAHAKPHILLAVYLHIALTRLFLSWEITSFANSISPLFLF